MALQEKNYLGDVCKWEMDGRHSRDDVVVLSGQSLAMGDVIGKITKSIPTTGTAGTNTGNGTCTNVMGGAKTKIGIYRIQYVSDDVFQVTDPDGCLLPDASVGTDYDNPQIKFRLTAGGTAFAAGDTFTIEVVAGSGKVKMLDVNAVDGSQEAFGIMAAGCDATGGDQKGVAIVRDAQIAADFLGWPVGITSGQKTQALAQLYEKGIVTRTLV